MSLYFKRLLEQTALVFAAAALPVFSLTDMSSIKTAAIAGGAAVLRFAYGLVVAKVGDPESPSIK